jgi:hypothetical protein
MVTSSEEDAGPAGVELVKRA